MRLSEPSLPDLDPRRECGRPRRGYIVRRTPILLVVALGLGTASAAQTRTEDPVDLEGFVVTADRLARPSWAVSNSASVLMGQELERAGVRYVADALRLLPGVSIARNGSFGATTSLFLRGGESDYVQVLIDGVPVNEPGGAFDFGSMTTHNIERIEVVRGPASALYGSDAVSGVVQIFTRRGQGGPSATLSAGRGSFGTTAWQAEANGGSPRTSYALSIGRTETDGILDFNNQHYATTVSGRLAVRPDPSTAVSTAIRYQDRRFHFPTDGSGALVDRNAFTFGEGYAFSADASRTWTDQLSTRITLGVNDTDSGTEDAPDDAADSLGFFAFTSLGRTQRHTADLRTHWQPRPGTTMALGYELERQEFRARSESRSEFGVSPSASENRRWNRAYYALFAGEADRFAVNVGARVEDNERYGSAVTYRGGAVWRSESGATRLRASAATAVKEPTFLENFATGFAVGNPDLQPERSSSFDAGFDQSLGRFPGTVSVSAFHQRFRDLIQFTFPAPADGGPNYFNLAEASSRGVEVEATGTLGPARLGAAYTFLDTEVVDSGADEGEGATFVEGARLLRRPTHQFAATARLDADDLGTFDLTLRRVGERDDRDFASFPAAAVVLPTYTILDIGGNIPVFRTSGGRPGLSVTVRLENALDAEYQEVWAFMAPGRALYVGGRVTFGARGDPR